MIDLGQVKLRYEAARRILGLSAPEGSFDFMLNFKGVEGTEIRLHDDGRVTITAIAQDRNSRIVDFETSGERELAEFLIDRAVRSCVVRDMMSDPESGTISGDEYLRRFERRRVYHCNKLIESGIVFDVI